MCGISGAFAFTEKGMSTLALVQNANECLTKRGPDGAGIFRKGKVALGHRRLSIIDTSCAGNQPMTTSDGRYTIVFNGEIFNYRELKTAYLSPDEQKCLRSQSDTEIFLLLYKKLREKVFPLLDGFFAASIYDAVEESVILVRDRFGKKPLLIYQDDDRLVFGSEMKALFQAGIPRSLNLDVLPVYFHLNYIPQPYSLVKGVRKLNPGHSLYISSAGLQESPFYQLTTQPSHYENRSYENAKKELVDLMDKAVGKRLLSDVPLGAFLSGGVDSSVVVAMASRHTKQLKTFSIGYKDNHFFDETYYAKAVAEKYKTDHTVFSLTNQDFLEHVHDVLKYIDEPFADSSAIPEYILCYYTRKHVTVALSGDGGDEVFAGYNKHAAEWKMRQGGLLNHAVKAGAPLWDMLPKGRHNKYTNKFRQLHRFAVGAHLSAADRYWQWAGFLSLNESSSLFHPTLQKKINSTQAEKIRQEFTVGIKEWDFNEVLLADMNLVLLSDMLVKVDLMSMANSLEVRSPFLDKDVVDFAFELPTGFKIDAAMKKRIVQDAFRSYLPGEIYNRPKKGFEIPLLQWLRKELWGMINDDLLSDSFIAKQSVFSLPAIQRLKAQLQSTNPKDSHATVWALIVFQYWWKQYSISVEE